MSPQQLGRELCLSKNPLTQPLPLEPGVHRLTSLRARRIRTVQRQCQCTRFTEAIRRRRNVYAGIERVPEVTDAGRVLLCELTRPGWDLADCLFLPLEAAAGRRKAGRHRARAENHHDARSP